MGNTFKDFLSIQVSKKTKKILSKSSVNNYSAGIKTISAIYKGRNTIAKDITEMSYQEFLSALSNIEKDPEYENRNTTQNNFDSATLHQYRNYLKILDTNPNIDFSDVTEDPDEIVEIEDKPIAKIEFKLPLRFSKYKNYCYSLLAKPFVILAGNSGTGKTKISTNIATWLGKRDTDGEIFNKLVVPVGADWTDNTKILGFYNPIEKIYESSKILDFILLAEEHPEVPFFLILDEMNLSHVERYFSDFLSAMESKEPIILYSRNSDCKCNIPETIVIPENLFVTGTVNIDETTYMFSPKVLDRANVIEFIPDINEVINNFQQELESEDIIPAENGMAEAFLRLAKEIVTAKSIPQEFDIENAKSLLKSISEELADTGFEFAFRTTKEIRLYINAAAKMKIENQLLEPNLNSILDEQVLQKILPKIHGNKRQIEELLNELLRICQTNNLICSAAKLEKMISRLNKYQFASFI